MPDFFGMPAAITVDGMVMETCLRWLREFGVQPSRIAIPNKLYKHASDCWIKGRRGGYGVGYVTLALDITTPGGRVFLVPDDEAKFIEDYMGGGDA